MSSSPSYPKRLIEINLPIREISKHARREKSIRKGHISTLHTWWARRPLAACRAVTCASLWPDPADNLCPPTFVAAAAEVLIEFAEAASTNRDVFDLVQSHWPAWNLLARRAKDAGHPAPTELREALLNFIAAFAAWEASCHPTFLNVAQRLTAAAHRASEPSAGPNPLVLDPFAGGGSFPLEALRVGADSFASDLNPIPILLNRALLVHIPRLGSSLADDLRTAACGVKERAEDALAKYFPSAGRDEEPVTFLWARQVRCEGPGCGVKVPLIRSLCLAQRGRKSIGLELSANSSTHEIDVSVVSGRAKFKPGTVKRGSVTCPACGYTTPVARVRSQLMADEGGADTSRLLAVVCRGDSRKTYHEPSLKDLAASRAAVDIIDRTSIIGDVELPLMSGVFNAPIYGMTRWDLLFSSRQLFAAATIGDAIREECDHHLAHGRSPELVAALRELLLLARGKYLDFRTTLCGWISKGEKIGHTFGRQALGMIFDWAEGTPFGNMSGSWQRSTEAIAQLIEREASALPREGVIELADARNLPLPDDSVAAVLTDPPYYNAVPYADLSDFFYLWLKPHLEAHSPSLFQALTAPKAAELCEMKGWDPVRYPNKDAAFYEEGMRRALEEARRVCKPDGIGVIVFAHKTTAGWESLLAALVDAGWVVTGSWPIDTERAGRLRAMRSAALGSSVHLVCRPRENPDGSLRTDLVGDWQSVLRELPVRIHEWLPRMATEGVVGADAIFACLGPALEVFSRYSLVEKASGQRVELGEYLEHVWSAVAQEALSMIFDDADATGLEEDSRLTAMWLWTLSTSANGNGGRQTADDGSELAKASEGYALEYDAARKIAQGLGAHLDDLRHVVEISGNKARLLSVSDRTRYPLREGPDLASCSTPEEAADESVR